MRRKSSNVRRRLKEKREQNRNLSWKFYLFSFLILYFIHCFSFFPQFGLLAEFQYKVWSSLLEWSFHYYVWLLFSWWYFFQYICWTFGKSFSSFITNILPRHLFSNISSIFIVALSNSFSAFALVVGSLHLSKTI